MAHEVSVLSSMATRALLVELGAGWHGAAKLEAVGGLEAARRIRAGETVDAIVLAAGALTRLEADGFVVPGSIRGIGVSTIAAAVRQGDPALDLSDVASLRRSVLAAGRIGYSTGPSGDHLLHLFKFWSIRDSLGERLVQAPPGVAVGQLLVAGDVDLAFQQRSELMDIPGIALAFPLPGGARADTVFAAGVSSRSACPDIARSFIDFLASPPTADAKRRHGMEPV